MRSPTWHSRLNVCPPKARCRMSPFSVRSNNAPHCSSSRTRSGASWAWSCAMRQLFRNFPPRIVSRKCVRQSSDVSTLAITAAIPPSAITVWALPSSDLHTIPTRTPCPRASIAARRPAPPAPMISTSCSWMSYFEFTVSEYPSPDPRKPCVYKDRPDPPKRDSSTQTACGVHSSG